MLIQLSVRLYTVGRRSGQHGRVVFRFDGPPITRISRLIVELNQPMFQYANSRQHAGNMLRMTGEMSMTTLLRKPGLRKPLNGSLMLAILMALSLGAWSAMTYAVPAVPIVEEMGPHYHDADHAEHKHGDDTSRDSEASDVVNDGASGQAPMMQHEGHPIAESIAPALSKYDFFTNFGAYMPRIHCMRRADGSPDWPWIIGLISVTGAIIVAYVRIFVFWEKAYRAENPDDRNTKLMMLAYLFLICAISGYVMSIVMFFWPAYRLLFFIMLVLSAVAWRFLWNINDLQVSLQARRLRRELKEAEQSRYEALEKEVQQRTRDLEEARAEAEAASFTKSAFLANMSHEIRTPMTAILGFTDLLREESLRPDDQTNYLDTIRRNGNHLLSIINDILDLSKIESGKMTIERLDTSVYQIVSDVMSLMRVRAKGKGIKLEAEYAFPIPATVKTDAIRLRQVLVNLVGNAIKFTEEGGVRLVVRYRPEPAVISFEVVDTGIGLSQEQIDKLFKPFSQADDSMTRRFGGTGLGLTISKRFAELLGGDITIDSTFGEGSTFLLTIDPGDMSNVPVLTNMSEAMQTVKEEPEVSVDQKEAKALKGRVLLAEDGPDNQRLISFVLRKAGLEVDIANNGEEAIKAIEACRGSDNPYRLILMDMQMPIMDGYTATRHLREIGETLPIIALTAHTMSGDREKCMEAGCTEFASKPIQKAGLLKMVSGYLSGDLAGDLVSS